VIVFVFDHTGGPFNMSGYVWLCLLTFWRFTNQIIIIIIIIIRPVSVHVSPL